jgi:hypothetical protein
MKIITSIILFLVFTFTSQAQTIWSDDFEDWEVLTGDYEQPTNWFTSNALQSIFGDPSNIIKSTDAHSGSYAASMVIPPTAFGEPYGSFMQITIPLTEKPYYFSGWHKNNPDQDTIQILSATFLWNVTGDSSDAIGGSIVELTDPLSEYTYFSYPLTYDNGSIPDTARILISFADISVSLNSTYTVDQLALQGTASTLDLERSEIPVYPNQSQGRFNIYLPNTAGQLQVTDLSGRTIQSRKQQAGQRISSVDISDQVNGIYIATFIEIDGKVSRQKLIVNQ